MSKPAEQMMLEMMLQFPSSVPNATVAVGMSGVMMAELFAKTMSQKRISVHIQT